jgi:hypothetical protein
MERIEHIFRSEIETGIFRPEPILRHIAPKYKGVSNGVDALNCQHMLTPKLRLGTGLLAWQLESTYVQVQHENLAGPLRST